MVDHRMDAMTHIAPPGRQRFMEESYVTLDLQQLDGLECGKQPEQALVSARPSTGKAGGIFFPPLFFSSLSFPVPSSPSPHLRRFLIILDRHTPLSSWLRMRAATFHSHTRNLNVPNSILWTLSQDWKNYQEVIM